MKNRCLCGETNQDGTMCKRPVNTKGQKCAFHNKAPALMPLPLPPWFGVDINPDPGILHICDRDWCPCAIQPGVLLAYRPGSQPMPSYVRIKTFRVTGDVYISIRDENGKWACSSPIRETISPLALQQMMFVNPNRHNQCGAATKDGSVCKRRVTNKEDTCAFHSHPKSPRPGPKATISTAYPKSVHACDRDWCPCGVVPGVLLAYRSGRQSKPVYVNVITVQVTADVYTPARDERGSWVYPLPVTRDIAPQALGKMMLVHPDTLPASTSI
jgi:hypothetical protein